MAGPEKRSCAHSLPDDMGAEGSPLYARALQVAIDSALTAGAILRQVFHHLSEPAYATAVDDFDVRAEQAIRARLTAAYPDWGFRGEETGYEPARVTPIHLWVVDPHDGTSAFRRGYRGTSVSIALLREGLPVLGVVYAFAAPDDNGDLFAWAEGCGPLTRNGRAVERSPWPDRLGPDDVVIVSQAGDNNAPANLRCVAPARFRKVPSIAYRLALVAAGEGEAGVSLNGPCSWDYAGGHALLRSVGGMLLDQDGREVTYSPTGVSSTRFCFGGAPGIVAELWRRPWREVMTRHTPEEHLLPELDLVALEPGRSEADPGVLSRAQGCLLGQVAGDALGSLVEFRSPVAIASSYPDGVRLLRDGGTWQTLAGQPTDDSEMALALARSIVRTGGYHRETVAGAYWRWYHSQPFDIGNTISQALREPAEDDVQAGRAAERMAAAAAPASQANGSLMRISPLGIWGCRLPLEQVVDCARADSALTHPHPVCQEACAAFVAAIARAVATGAEAAAIYDDTLRWAERSCRAEIVLATLQRAAQSPPADYLNKQGWVLIALQNAFYQLLHAPSLEEGVVRTVMAGGDTDTNAAIAGALLGAVHGRDAIPLQWRRLVLSCRPASGVPAVRRPRPRAFWPVDVLELAERLLLATPND